MSNTHKLIYPKTDEAPALATYLCRPIVEAFAATSGIELETKDISLSGRVLAVFADPLTPEQQQEDELAVLGEMVKKTDANLIKLPNI